MGFWETAGGVAKFVVSNAMSQAADVNARRSRDKRYSSEERKEFREQADQYRKCARKVNNINSMSDLFDSENSNGDMA